MDSTRSVTRDEPEIILPGSGNGGEPYAAPEREEPKKEWFTAKRGIYIGVGALVVVLGVVAFFGLTSSETTSEDAAKQFLEAIDEGDWESLEGVTGDPAAVQRAIEEWNESLGLIGTKHEILGFGAEAESATVDYRSRYELGGAGIWEVDSQANLEKIAGTWTVIWDDTILHPQYKDGQSVERVVFWPERAGILGADGQQLIDRVPAVVVGAVPERVTNPVEAKTKLADILGVEPADFDEKLNAEWVQPSDFVPIIKVRRERYDAAKAQIYPVPGLVFKEDIVRAPLSDEFGVHLLGTTGEVTAERLEELGPPYKKGDIVGLTGLEADYELQLSGTPQTEVVLTDSDGNAVESLRSFEGKEPQPIYTTIDIGTQAAADAALAGYDTPAAVVAMDMSGNVRAVSSRPLGDEFNRALSGTYPPGSTFKVATATALLEDGMAPFTDFNCSAEIVVDGKPFTNAGGAEEGAITFEQAFARSCNTAVIDAAQGLPDGDLAAAAGMFGFGAEYAPGVAAATNNFPVPLTPVDLAAAAIGQGEITASPLHMASVAAAAASGTWNSPVVIEEKSEKAESVRLDPNVQQRLSQLMRLVIQEGTGQAANLDGERVYGKTGTAEFGNTNPPGTHAWFIGYRGDVAVAVLVEGGHSGGEVAAPIARSFFEALG